MYHHHDVQDIQSQYFRKPLNLTKRQALSRFLYNKETKEYCGRTTESWAKIGFFYTCFYGVLAALVAVCMLVFMRTIDPRVPKWQLEESLIGTNPGLGFRPLPPDDNVESTLIWYRGAKGEQIKFWTESLDAFLKPYKTPGSISGRGQNIYECNYNQRPGRGQVCDVKIEKFGPECIQENHYSYHKSSPCIFLKLNKIYGWTPRYFNDTEDLPRKMPDSLKKLVKDTSVRNPIELDTVWVSCEGENPADVENIGPIEYYPQQGFPGYYFPYENSEGYLSPLVAVHFKRPVRGIIINIECKAWAQNIRHDRQDRIGSVHFELMID